MTTAEKVLRLKQDFDEVYDAGYEQGKSEGGGVSDDSVLGSLIDRSITEIEIPEGVTTIGSYAFASCSKAKKLTIPNTVTSIRTQAFNTLGSSTEIDEVIIPDSVTQIGGNAFFYSGVKKFIISKNITSIPASAFQLNTKCTLFDFTRHEVIPTLQNVNAFGSINAEAKILVPAALYDEWIVATNWAEYADYIEPHYSVSEGLEYKTDNYGNKYVIGRGSCTDSVIVIPDGITAIAGGAFANDTVIDTLVLPESGVTIECRPSDGLGGVEGSSLRKIVNYYNALGFAFSGLSLEYISFVETPQAIDGLVFCNIQGSPTYDFSKCTAVVQISGDVEYMSVGEETQIIVPASLYDDWVADTNWAYYADYIVAAE